MKGSGISSGNDPVRVFVDTNVLIDILYPGRDADLRMNSGLFLDLSTEGVFKYYVSTISLATVFYFLRKLPKEVTHRTLDALLMGIEVTPTPAEAYDYCWKSSFNDLEDAMQAYCAQARGCSIIVTNNIRDFKSCDIEALTPAEFLEKFTY